ncbi:hypothetical protein SAMN03159338_4071 [Sphingomonas sp. NFR04]|uniref:DUF6118 family protein n=1 Tax=Sphingomonas sp. NFR04 TaxID=1566283 RepID=UPI0008ECCB9E|nr:DUF6118 family protein [Sphingomonas sp. NFR04]SFK37493.1 hypothetical protein SAMN03159338_4071 [Sphingomonas sp. NFR04]
MGSQEPPAEADQTVQAFNDMSRKLAGLTAAIDGFAARQQELHARDYGPDLEKIRDGYDKVCGAINILAKRPAMTLTPQDVAKQIEAAGTQGRADDHRAWTGASHALAGTLQELKGMVASAHSAETQQLWIAGAAALALLVGFASGAAVPTVIAQLAPESWHRPEERAAAILRRTPWDAGVRLMQIANPQQVRTVADAAQLAKDNADVLTECRKRAEQLSAPVKCSIKIHQAKID